MLKLMKAEAEILENIANQAIKFILISRVVADKFSTEKHELEEKSLNNITKLVNKALEQKFTQFEIIEFVTDVIDRRNECFVSPIEPHDLNHIREIIIDLELQYQENNKKLQKKGEEDVKTKKRARENKSMSNKKPKF